MDNDNTYILAIDMGTSGPKVALFDGRGGLVDYEFSATPLILLPGGGAEQDPAGWWQAICNASRRLLEKNAPVREQIAGICCTTQWSGTVAVDQAGVPLMNAIIWMDARGAPYARQVTSGPLRVSGYGAERLLTWIRLTGGVPGHAGKDSIAHILYIQRELPEIYAQTYKFLEPKDYINLKLTGRFAATYDSITLHWVTDNRDLSRVDYHPRLLQMAGIARDKLPDLLPPASLLGNLTPQAAAELGLPVGIPVAGGTPDIQSAALGSGATRDYQPHLYIGTSSWLSCHVPTKQTDVLHNLAALPSAIPGRYVIANEQQTSGACLTFLRDNILYHQDELLSEAGVPDVYPIFDRLAGQAAAGSGGLIFTPWLYGERTPVDDRAVRGGFTNLSLRTSREHIIRAIFEGVAYNTRWLLGYMEKFTRRRLEPINLVGGGAQSVTWCQILADVLGRTVRQVKDPILANARGAAFLALASLGRLSFEDIPEKIQIRQEYHPNPDNRPVYEELYREFLNLYRVTRPIYARLNR